MKTFLLRSAFVLTGLLALAACGGGGGSSSDDGGGGGTTPGTNGLDFGANGQDLSDAEGTAVTMRSASFQAGSGPSIEDATITLDAGFFNGGTANIDGRIEIFGQSVDITNGAGTLPTGENVVVIFEPGRAGTYAAALEVQVSAGTGTINGEQAYVFGFETNPSQIAARTSGRATYSGDFQAFGSIDGSSNTQTEYEGQITIVVDFTGSGNADVDLDGTLNGATNVDLSADNLPISGNGFTGSLACAAGCSGGGSSIDATFYGPDAVEVGGVLDIDVSVSGDDFDGVGTFVIDQGP
ncbi:transferrin-binding protein-like solute binding protein [Cognatiyoonia sp. IB215182]|uniref:transferrin-binding protein-like solute binding protein n=1 Tax=Cognatiyoonia sp. IB215182 TaxID=3097353 RepID=UPI002A116376|nr:transferrin-binding protein-like solute binding protein [Cognatiyoonia sp. IB215182]MDX8353490.1 hypothetical protein [Cognatiyoonia sp. IB215182]